MKKFVPLMEIFSAALFIRAQNAAAFELLTNMVTSGQAFTNLARWFVRHLDRLTQELSTVASGFADSWIDFLLPKAAHANISRNAAEIIVKQLIEVVEIGQKISVKNSDELADHYNTAVAQLLKMVDEAGDQLPELLGTAAKESNIVKAFIMAADAGGTDAVKAISKINGVNGFGLGDAFNQAKMIEAIALVQDIDFIKVLSKSDKDEMFAALYKKMGSETFRTAKGANHQLLSTIEFMKRNPNAEFLGFEKSIKVEFNGVVYGGRDYDAVFRLYGKTIRVEHKAWSGGYLKQGLRRALSNSGKIRKDGTDPSGQMTRDFAEFAKAGGGEFNTKWFFSPEAVTDAGLKHKGLELTQANIDRVRKEIAEEIGDLMVNDEAIKKTSQQALGFTGNSRQWEDFVFGDGDNFAFVDKLADELIEIDNYKQITGAIDL